MVIVHSGGATGSDSAFANISMELGFKVKNHSFYGHKINCRGEQVIHTKEELEEADYYLLQSNKILKRNYPTTSLFINNLLRRNYHQVINSNFIIAVTQLETESTVKGGTGWAVEIAKQFFKTIFVFDDGKTNHWYRYNYETGYFSKIKNLKINKNSIFAGIGTRSLTDVGYDEIKKLLENLK